MKPKKLVKRLSLGKSTVANLGDTEKRAVKAGYWETRINGGCGTWHPICFSMPVYACPYTPVFLCPETEACPVTQFCQD